MSSQFLIIFLFMFCCLSIFVPLRPHRHLTSQVQHGCPNAHAEPASIRPLVMGACPDRLAIYGGRQVSRLSGILRHLFLQPPI
jgi:hypothetical protein